MERRMGRRELKMKNVELRITSHSDRHPDPECSGEGSAQLINLTEIPCLPQAGSLSLHFAMASRSLLRMTDKFLIREAL